MVELPAKAVEVIRSMDSKERARGARMVLRLFLTERHSLAPSLVAAIAKAFPDLAEGVSVEAVRLFPEHSESIVRAAFGAVPQLAQSIAMAVMIEEPHQTNRLLGHLRRQNPVAADRLVQLALDNRGERTEQIAAAIYTTKNRIGTSNRLTPISMDDPTLNNPPKTSQQVFESESGPDEIPEDLGGSEIVDTFDVIMRQLLMKEDNAFIEMPQVYVR